MEKTHITKLQSYNGVVTPRFLLWWKDPLVAFMTVISISEQGILVKKDEFFLDTYYKLK